MKKIKLFVTGISTDVGKTIVSSILTEALLADYWKPIQAGDLDNSDTMKVGKLISNTQSKLHPESYKLNTPASPHLAAEIDNVVIDLAKIVEPKTENHLIIEGAGGLLVPLNAQECIDDLIKPDYKVVVVSRNYLGSINHTLLTIEALQHRNIPIFGIVFSGEENQSTESFIAQKTNVRILPRLEQEPYFDKNVILEYAEIFREIIKIE